MAKSSADSSKIDNLLRVFEENANKNPVPVKLEDQEQWMTNSIFFPQIVQDLSIFPTIGKETSSVSKATTSKESEGSADEETPREIKLYSAAQFRSHINRLYPYHLDYFSTKISALDFEQHKMGLYIFYDVNQGYLINDLEKEAKKKSTRGKNMKRMNGLLLNEHRMFNECAKEYATQHLKRDYEAMKSSINHFMQEWLKRKTDFLQKRTSAHDQYYSLRMNIPLNSYDAVTPITFINLSTVLRLGTLPLLTIPENLQRTNVKCSDDHDRVITNRFNSNYRLTNLVDDPNLLAILSQHPSIDMIVSKSSFHQLIELFSSPGSSPMTLPISIREFQFDTVDNPSSPVTKKKVIFIDKPLRQQVYTKRQLNTKYSQRAFRSLLISTTGGKREATDNQFMYTSFNNKTEFSVTEIKNKTTEKPLVVEEEKKTIDDVQDDDDDDDEEDAMIISTDGDNEEQQKLFSKSKQKIIHSAPVLQERETTNPDTPANTGPVPIVNRVKLATPIQGNYEYCLWQLGTLQLLIRSSYHGFCRPSTDNVNDELITCYSKLEYQPQFGCEQITDREYRLIWLESYLRHGTSVLLGRVNVYTQQLLKIEQMTYENIDRNLKECQIDMLKPITKVYGLLYGLQSLEVNNYLLSCPLNDDKLHLYQSGSKESTEKVFDLYTDPIESNELLVSSDCTVAPWIPLTPTLLLPYHLDFERIPLTFCPRKKRSYDIEMTIPVYRKRRDIVVRTDRKKKRKMKKKNNQRRKKKNVEESKE